MTWWYFITIALAAACALGLLRQDVWPWLRGKGWQGHSESGGVKRSIARWAAYAMVWAALLVNSRLSGPMEDLRHWAVTLVMAAGAVYIVIDAFRSNPKLREDLEDWAKRQRKAANEAKPPGST
jgi:hypothetical protein